jgi:membrane-associated phospholipid phosphatase
MTVAYLTFVVGVVVIALAGVAVWRFEPLGGTAALGVKTRLVRVRETARTELGTAFALLAILFSIAAAGVGIAWGFGRFAKRFVSTFDEPFLRWTLRHVSATGSWHHINMVLTRMGNRPQIKLIVLVSSAVFALLWFRRGFWIPPVLMVGTFFMEKGGQMILRAMADRPKPALASLGAFPSGGCARLLTVYGMVFFLALLTWPKISRPWRVTGWTVLALLAFIEGYTRIYLLKHWGMDVVGGWLYGTLMLLALVAAASCLTPRLMSTANLQQAEFSDDTVAV